MSFINAAPKPIPATISRNQITKNPAIPGLPAAIAAAAPHADLLTWVSALDRAFWHFGIADKPLRMAMALGQFAVEAGDAFEGTTENTCYTSAARLCQVFPSEFPTLASTEGYVGNAIRIADRCYAGKLGNGNQQSGDGSKYLGRGLIQITGKDDYTKVAAYFGMTLEAAVDWCETPDGAAMSGCWYLQTRGCLELADVWNINAVTERVNGRAMLGASQRMAASNAARQAFSA